ncbi:MAG: gfo/Idh/MocA family oxidoreductase, partial [Bacteroidetes bacterium]
MFKIGIIGVGHLGKFHVNSWLQMPDVQVVGFFDPNDANAQEVEEKFAIPRFQNLADLIAKVDAVDIVAPTNHHFPLCKAAILQGKHVFVEKPLANTMQEAKEILQMVKEAGVKMQVGHVERFNPAFQAIKHHKLQPMFIEVHRLAQFNPRGTEVSVILDLMIHDIDIILSIVKSDIKQVSASGVAVMTDTPDIANVRIEFHNGCVANLTSSRISMKKMRKIRLFQKDAYIGIDFLEKKAEIIKMKDVNDTSDDFTLEIDTPQGSKTISISNPAIENGNAILTELVSFKNA